VPPTVGTQAKPQKNIFARCAGPKGKRKKN